MRKFHALTVTSKRHETADSVRLALRVPDELRDAFDFLPGQHLPVEVTIDGRPLRRTYSICSAPGQADLELGIRVQPGGLVSGHLAGEVQPGDRLMVMPPFGQFHATLDPTRRGNYLALAAGSGITPILSIVRATLETEPDSRFLLLYGNRQQGTTMFIDDLYALKNRFPERLQLVFLFSREAQEFPLFDGRLDGDKTAELVRLYCRERLPDEAFICGPDTMLDTARSALLAAGMDAGAIHAERYGAPRRRAAEHVAAPAGDHECTVNVIMDGHAKSFRMPADATSIVDAAAAAGLALPFSCKGGVCATCRTHLREGAVRMETNYGLEPWEVEQGFILACQSQPLTDTLTLDYDKI